MPLLVALCFDEHHNILYTLFKSLLILEVVKIKIKYFLAKMNLTISFSDKP